GAAHFAGDIDVRHRALPDLAGGARRVGFAWTSTGPGSSSTKPRAAEVVVASADAICYSSGGSVHDGKLARSARNGATVSGGDCRPVRGGRDGLAGGHGCSH